MYFYQRIKDLREDNDLTQKQLAQILHTTQPQYVRYETGERELPAHHFITLAKLYNISADYLLGLTNTARTLDGKPYTINKNITITQKGNGNEINIKN